MVEERLYLDGCEIYRRHAGANADFERHTLHIMGEQGRVCVVETKTREDGARVTSRLSRQRFQCNDHLGSSAVELDREGRVITYEEYFPFGGTAFHAMRSSLGAVGKRFRYSGSERDEESGLYHIGARYYAAWLGRWTAPDPAGVAEHPNLFLYVSNSPLVYRDPTGAFLGSVWSVPRRQRGSRWRRCRRW